MSVIELNLPDLDATERLGRRIAERARPGDAVLLSGPLGAGKSAIARALLRALAGDPALEVPSPTFTLVQSYQTSRLVAHHLDLWRLPAWQADARDTLTELGWDDWDGDLLIVEWPERLGPRAPADALTVDLAMGPVDGGRSARLDGWGDRPGLAA